MKNIFPLINQSKLTDLTVENILFTGESLKMQITDSISENLINLDLESTNTIYRNTISKMKRILLDQNQIFPSITSNK